nr:hypothetical protein [Tanacetum cinerariifolium]
MFQDYRRRMEEWKNMTEKQKASYEKVAKQKTKVYARNGGLKLYSCLTREKMETIIKDKNKKMEEKNKKVSSFPRI